MIRNIILKKEIEDNKIVGFFITEEEYKKNTTTTVKQVEASTITKRVNYINEEVLQGLQADEIINKYISEGYKVRKDHVTESKSTGFRVIDNLTHQVIGSYNWN